MLMYGGSMIILSDNKEGVKKLIKEYSTQGQKYYVYILIRPDQNKPFYVGKGKNQRIFEHEKEVDYGFVCNPYKVNIIKKILSSGSKLIYAIDSFFTSEEDALDRECKLIAEIGRSELGAGSLTNRTDGGDGFLGLIDFSNHARSGRNIDKNDKYSWLPGDINVLMERTEGVREEELLDYLKKGMYGEDYRENIANVIKKRQQNSYGETFDVLPPEEYFKKYEWDEEQFWAYHTNGYGAESETFSYIYGKRQDIALKTIELNEKLGKTYFRREDEMKAFIHILFSTQDWLDINEIKHKIMDRISEYKQPSDFYLVRSVYHFVEKLVATLKISKDKNMIRWNSRNEKATVICQGLKASEIVDQVDRVARKNKNAYVEFYLQNGMVADHLILFPHYFRHGLKTYFKQTIVLKLNTHEICFLKIYAL